VRDGHVAGWDDPRMPTLAGLRRRGVPPEAMRRFIRGVGASKANSTVDDGVLDAAIRDVAMSGLSDECRCSSRSK